MSSDHTPRSRPSAEGGRDVLGVLASGIAKTASSGALPDPQHRRGTVLPVEPGRELLTEIMLADRWVC